MEDYKKIAFKFGISYAVVLIFALCIFFFKLIKSGEVDKTMMGIILLGTAANFVSDLFLKIKKT